MVLMFMVEYSFTFFAPLRGKETFFFNNKTEELINTQKKAGKKFLVIDHGPSFFHSGLQPK